MPSFGDTVNVGPPGTTHQQMVRIEDDHGHVVALVRPDTAGPDAAKVLRWAARKLDEGGT